MPSQCSINWEAEHGFCHVCASVDYIKRINVLMKSPSLEDFMEPERLHLHDFHTLRRGCPLCRLFLTIIERPDTPTGEPLEVESVKISLSTSYDSSLQVHDGSFRVMLPTFLILIRYPNKDDRLECLSWQLNDAKIVHTVKPCSIEYGSLKNAIQMCSDTHTTCGRTVSHKDLRLKLIDCRTREVFRADSRPRDKYAALSYVWGSSTDGLKHVNPLPANLPATIEDAIRVTRHIGIKYLWVDRYCIDQENAREVLHQIALMDMIYRNAAITIIAACGEDPSYGLPGVNRRARHAHPCLTAANIHFFQLPKATNPLVLQSRWNRRAWTYQEAVFSRMRLVFTDEQIYYECFESRGFEAFNFAHLENNGSSGLPQQHQGSNTKESDVFRHIETYSKRSLGNPEDAINAVAGILHACEVDVKSYHHWGIPIRNCPVGWNPFSLWLPAMQFFSGLTWAREGLIGSADTGARRRDFAPSWSWAGWEDAIVWPDMSQKFASNNAELHTSSSLEDNLEVELLDGQVLDWDEFLTYDRDTRQSMLSPFIHITAMTTTLQVRQIQGNSSSRNCTHEAEAEARDGSDKIIFKFSRDSVESIPPICQAIHLNDTGDPILLIVAEVRGRLERVGILNDRRNFIQTNAVVFPMPPARSYARMKKVRKTLRLC